MILVIMMIMMMATGCGTSIRKQRLDDDDHVDDHDDEDHDEHDDGDDHDDDHWVWHIYWNGSDCFHFRLWKGLGHKL